MSLDLEVRLRRLLASAPQRVHQIQTLEISHSAMSKTYRLWHEPYAGQITIESGQVVAVECINFKINLAGSPASLDQLFDVQLDLTDHEDEFREQMDRVPINTTERVLLVYREYLSDDLASIQATARLQVEGISYTIGGAKMSAASPRFNISTTGEKYTPLDVPMLRGFL